MKRLTLSLLFVVLASMVGLGWVLDQWYSNSFKTQEDPTLLAYKRMGLMLAQQLDQLPPEQQSAELAPTAAGISLGLVDAVDFPLPLNLQRDFEREGALLLKSGPELTWNFYLPRTHQVLTLPLPADVNSQGSQQLRWLLTLLFYGGIIFVVLLWLYPLLHRLALLRRSARAFGAGDLSIRIEHGAVSYIHDIEMEFNRMAQRIEQLIADNKLLSSGLSHDLRTPLARLRFGLDVLAETPLNELHEQQTLAHLNRDLEAMESLVDIFLQYARLEQATIVLTLEPIIFSNILRRQIEIQAAPNLLLNISPEANEKIICGNRKWLSILCDNLIQNALKYCLGQVSVSVKYQGDNLVFCVEDDGPGIAPEERAKVLQPFYRTQSAQSFNGHGMGLAIVERIVFWHKAKLLLTESQTLGGLSIQVSFPLSAA